MVGNLGEHDDLKALLRPLPARVGTLRSLAPRLEGAPAEAVDRAVGNEVSIDFVERSDGTVRFEPPARGADPNVGLGTIRRRTLVFDDLGGNRVSEGIAKIDDWLTPERGLSRLTVEGGREPVQGRLEGRSLLLVHGTFLNSTHFVDDIVRGDVRFLPTMFERYDHVLTLDYATLSLHPLLNALMLARLAGTHLPGPIDVVAYSQGALVTRYWFELLDRARLSTGRAVFVGGTLGGTSLAAPPRLRAGLDMLTNVAWALRTVGDYVASVAPMFSAAAGVFGVLERTLSTVSSVPIFDAGVVLVPGLSGMSRVSTNAELAELRRSVHGVPSGYFAVTADFEPVSPGWAFWKGWGGRIADGAADALFRAPNDLVVDTVAQVELSDAWKIEGPGRVHHFAAGTADVHHLSYFRDPSTLAFIANALRRDGP